MTQLPPPMPVGPASYPAPRRPGPGLGISLAVIGIGVAVGIISVIAIAIPLAGTFTSPVYTVPNDISVHLHHARYIVYQRTGTRSGFGSSTLDPPAALIGPSSLVVIAPRGIDVPVDYVSSNESIDRDSSVYSGVLEFEAPVGGDYTLRFTNPAPTRVVVARSLRDAVQSVLVWFGVGALGTGVLIAGVVMLIVGATRRGRAKRATYAGPIGWGAPGYGPPPYSPQSPYPPPPYGTPPPYPAPPPPGAPPPGPANPWDPPAG